MEMEEDTNRAVILCPSTYVNDHVGFCGKIKKIPSDFVVTEINEFGQLVNEITIDDLSKSNETISEKSRFCQQDHKKLRLSLLKPCMDEVQEDGLASEYLMPSTGEIEDCKGNDLNEFHHDSAATLNSLLEESVCEQLNQFASHVKSALNSKAELAAISSEFSLGPVLDKRLRASLHGSIRQQYPFLVTVTKCGEIIVKANQDYKELCRLVSEEEACGFLKFLDAKLENSKFSFKPDGNKEHRTMVHHFISKKFGKLVETKSFSDSQQKVVITVRFREKSGFRKRVNADCREQQDIYTAFTLQKENLETLEAISYLSSKLGVLPSDFSYTGIKDKKAVTYQSMVVKKVSPQRLKELADTIEKKGVTVSNVRSANQPLRLGQLQGNRFDIIVRDLKHQSNDCSASLEKRVSEAIENIKRNGFINYYGPQRFGQGQSIQTDQIGLALLNKELVKAVQLFFTPEDADDPVNKAKKYFLQTEDPKGTLAMLPDYKIREKMLLRALNRYGINQEGCTRGWLSIPHSMRIFYIHAYCSKIWNEAAAYRIKIYGTRVVSGDLIFCEKSADSSLMTDKVHIVAPEEEIANKYTINQVILPMAGYSVQYPTHKLGEWYHERLAGDGLQTCTFRLPELQLNVPGCYRYLLKQPHNLSYHFLTEDKKEIGNGDSPLQDSEGSLSLSFWLDPSCYATVCLREIMKCDL
ncbi:pseudouridylate synthase PUS7L [Tiliqua scincoides]|uniref:pseudouridylate synthase PUS7L n=1 Tax=Tiliqua scincoides TaxID=71010 RepID=UPI003462A1DC